MRTAIRDLAGLALAAQLAACAAAPAPGGPTPGTPATPPRGVPGFDTRAYPGDATMKAWRAASPYRWVGYYLPAPCHTDPTWVRRRAALTSLGWGTAVVYTGEQDWDAMGRAGTPTRVAAGDTTGAASAAPAPSAAASQGVRCTRANLTAERGAADAAEADSAAAAEGFPAGSTIYLDVERVDSVSAPLASYVRAWIAGLLERGRFRAGVYAAARNADSLRALQQREYERRGVAGGGRFWVAGGAGTFEVVSAPAESALPYATIWQGAADVRQGWAGITLRIDVDVADRASPSAP